MKSVLFIYPHQLFQAEHLPKVDQVYVIEEPLYFGTDEQYPMRFHKQKLVLHRAGMRRYVEEVLWANDFAVEYFDIENTSWTGQPLVHAYEQGFDTIYVFDPTDYTLEKRLKTVAKEQERDATLHFLPTPNFYIQNNDIQEFFGEKKQYKMADFYQWQRERFNILIDNNFRPKGGKWSYDAENRKKLPNDVVLPGIPAFGDSKHVSEALKFVGEHFSSNPGSLDSFVWPTSHAEAKLWLDDFLKHRFSNFGPYEDAISGRGIWLFHSVLSSSLNCGLLNPKQVIDEAILYADKNNIPISSLEGFVRQILGWREYMRAMYVLRGTSMRKSNVLKHERTLTQHWYDGTTGLAPLDDVINKVQEHAYAHHIERLMIVGNAMLLSEINPNNVYKWFMELFIDAYDWVMVPNVFGMSQFADGGSITTKPYMSASNYILTMSDYNRDEWCNVWDGLYWRFVEKHRLLLKKNPRLGGLLVSRLDSMDPARRRIINYRAEDFLANRTS